jgi:hypothetical protein
LDVNCDFAGLGVIFLGDIRVTLSLAIEVWVVIEVGQKCYQQVLQNCWNLKEAEK